MSRVSSLNGLRLSGGDEDTFTDIQLFDKDETVAEGTDTIDERQVTISQVSGTVKADVKENLNERLIGLDDGCFCGEVESLKDGEVELPIVGVNEVEGGGSVVERLGGMKGTQFHGIVTFIRYMDGPEVPEKYDRYKFYYKEETDWVNGGQNVWEAQGIG